MWNSQRISKSVMWGQGEERNAFYGRHRSVMISMVYELDVCGVLNRCGIGCLTARICFMRRLRLLVIRRKAHCILSRVDVNIILHLWCWLDFWAKVAFARFLQSKTAPSILSMLYLLNVSTCGIPEKWLWRFYPLVQSIFNSSRNFSTREIVSPSLIN